MRRREFLKVCGLLGIGLPIIGCASGTGTGSDDVRETGDGTTDGLSVLIVGAGAAGLCAGHLLAQRAVDVHLLEAAPIHGGRMKRTTAFVDFPIPLGAEWLHADAGTLAAIADDERAAISIPLAGYAPDTLLGYVDDGLTLAPLGDHGDLKFVGSTWLDFFDQYVVAGIVDRITFDTHVVEIDHSGNGVILTDAVGATYDADAVIVTVPITVLRDRDVEFVPELPASKREALAEADIWGGMKVFFEFEERFYPTFVGFPDSLAATGQYLYYDAAHGQETRSNVLGLFAVGDRAEPYQSRTGDELRDFVLAELDGIFDGAASRTFIQYLAQDWSQEPFIRQAYLADGADWRGVREMGRPVGDRVWFAGDAYTDGEDWSSVHIAARSARVAVDELLDRFGIQ